ncbi:sulfurtransferase complex subunit TusB [Celerinatantimonas sp. YJH-8]|uniref:sulfurtransferase complex subunit TusB n=1 Tax=Celerinatantimonas sp. YJH-8 TaxID=3228714 RepID=UPI0038BF35D1
MLHVYRRSEYPSSTFDQCWQMLAQDDVVLLIENGVYLWCYEDPRIQQLAQQQRLFLLADDVTARAIDVPLDFQLSMTQWVELTENHSQLITWS